MKYAFISDIHGNAVALEAVLEHIKKQEVDKIIVLGDICYRGPEPKKSLELVRSLQTEVVKGNADEWIVRGVKSGEVPEDVLELMNKERAWAFTQLEPSDTDYLQGLPHSIQLDLEKVKVSVFHATPDSLFDIILPNEEDEIIEKSLMTTEAQVYIYGHIHVPYIRFLKGKIVINTGSVGLPFDGLSKASYAIVECNAGNIKTSIERVTYDKERVIELYKEVGYPNAEMMSNIIYHGKR
ncbi:metallophosphoesterase [Anaerobacillus alkaliphilus]|uniref:Phosphoesterase n=1 Tax=Anaerobacillus alkaliphilus TaxID=1548597 RepID=A0A4Q0VNM8_9BACI|nr:metallophosphoesterase family protein [Anaerobacillus alkaliphilus]RXI97758.1 metallophosphoesterase [Anaerobacillus alkaliphilus]